MLVLETGRNFGMKMEFWLKVGLEDFGDNGISQKMQGVVTDQISGLIWFRPDIRLQYPVPVSIPVWFPNI